MTDRLASSRTWAAFVVLVAVSQGGIAGAQDCVGDCNGDREVQLNELILGVNLALGSAGETPCDAFDSDENGAVSVDELLLGVRSALLSCGANPAGRLRRVGEEFQVNAATSGDEECPAAAMNAARDFVVGWRAGNFLSASFARSFDAEGDALGDDLALNASGVVPFGTEPRLAVDSEGNFLLAWVGGDLRANSYSLLGQIVGPSGGVLVPAFEIGDSGVPLATVAGLAAAPDGSFLLVTSVSDGSGLGVSGLRLDAEGQPIGSEFQVNSAESGDQDRASVAAGENGFVVTWTSSSLASGDPGDIIARRLDTGGLPVGSEFRVNTYTRQRQDQASVAALTNGNFVLVWESESQEGPNEGVFVQLFDSQGNRLGTELQANTYARADQGDASVAPDRDGGFVVVWESEKGSRPRAQDGSEGGVFAQRFDSEGNRIGIEFQVNTHTLEDQGTPWVAGNGSGDFVVVWESTDQDGAGEGVFGQRLRVEP